MITKRIITDLTRTAPYLIRWSVWLPFGMSLKVHQILRVDDDRCPHDHPWWFLRIILWGGYWEEWADESDDPDDRLDRCGRSFRKPWRPWAPWRIYFCGTRFRHRITDLPRGQSWTLALCGPRIREWGFFTKGGWMQWRQFVDAALAKRVLWCDDGRTLNDQEST